MNEVRYASLSSGLLARKGSAKPAMRPQGYTGFEDLGWNDMGTDGRDDRPAPVEHVPSSIAALTPVRGGRPMFGVAGAAPSEAQFEAEAEVEAEVEQTQHEAPAIVAQQRAIAERFEEEEVLPAPQPAAARPAPAKVVVLPTRPAVQTGKKAAFTLRLDADRHMRLRLACAIEGRSAQQIVTAALDRAMAEIPEIEALATRMPSASAKRN